MKNANNHRSWTGDPTLDLSNAESETSMVRLPDWEKASRWGSKKNEGIRVQKPLKDLLMIPLTNQIEQVTPGEFSPKLIAEKMKCGIPP